MSITKSAEQRGGEMRLQEMTVEGGNEKAPVFDIEQEIGDPEKQIWRSIIDKICKKEDWGNVTSHLSSASMLFPEEIDSVVKSKWGEGTTVGDSIIVQAKKDIAEQVANTNHSNKKEAVVWLVSGIKAVFPDFPISELGADDAFNYWFEGEKLKEIPSWTARGLLITFADLQVIFPEKMRNSRQNLETNAWPEIMEELAELRKKGSWRQFAINARFTRIAFPDKFQELEIKEEDWREMKNTLDASRDKGDWGEFFLIAECMKVLAAREVIVDEKGLRLVMPEKTGDFKEEKPELPVRRKF